jgi:hypothetical protein
MPKKGKIVRKSWTTESLRQLNAHSRKRTPIAVISKQMQRTIGALRQQAFRMGIPLGEHAKPD